jgi:uncharacterized membrane protein YcaP (DUF421 family)
VFRREGGEVGTSDLLVLVLIADAVQNAMANECKSLSEGIALALTICGWDFIVNWISYHYPWFERLITPAPLALIKNGRMIANNLRKELISRDELMSQLREHGVEQVSQVKCCFLEADGKVSVSKF